MWTILLFREQPSMSFPISSQVGATDANKESELGRCSTCKDWKKSCFRCTFSNIQRRFSLRSLGKDGDGDSGDDYNLEALAQISSLEYLSNNVLQIMQPQEDGTFAEQTRRPNAPARNEPLALFIMEFTDSVLKQNREAALLLYIEGLMYHNAHSPLNMRVLLLLVELGRDVEAYSFLESLVQWPTMKFTQEIWFECRDSLGDDIDISQLGLESRVIVAYIKYKIVTELEDCQKKLLVFDETTMGQDLMQVRSIFVENLGLSSFYEEQMRQFDRVIQTVHPTTREAILGLRTFKESPELVNLLRGFTF